MSDANRKLERLISRLLADYVGNNRAAQIVKAGLDEAGIGLKPVIDHLTLRTVDVEERAREFIDLGYRYGETLEYDAWFAKVYRSPGFPALFIDQAYPDARGKTCLIPAWVQQFGDKTLHHAAVRVEDIEIAVRRLKDQGVAFAGTIVGEPGALLRQIFTAPERRAGEAFSVLELTERHAGYQGFSPPHANALMRSTVMGN